MNHALTVTLGLIHGIEFVLEPKRSELFPEFCRQCFPCKNQFINGCSAVDCRELNAKLSAMIEHNFGYGIAIR